MANAALDRRVQEVTGNVIDMTTRGVRYVWSNVADLSDDAAASAVAQVVPLVGGAQRSIAALYAAYVSRVTGLPLSAPEVATLVPQADWNLSPMIQARRLVGEGLAVIDAFEQAAARAAQVHSGDVNRARNDAATALADGVEPLRPVRYAKMPNPNACAWCRTVSTRLYYRADGLPVHLNCRCGVQAITPADAGGYTNASTVFENYRWRSRVSTQELAETQRRIAASAADLAASANASMLRAA